MAYIIKQKYGKPIMYYKDDGTWVCRGDGVEVEGNSQRGTYTRWRNVVAFHQLPDHQKAKLQRQGAVANMALSPMFQPLRSKGA